MNTYILDENDEPQACNNLFGWSQWMGTIDRRLLYDVVGDAEVSTVFLGINYRHVGDGPPILWETMIFGGEHDKRITRYITKLAALQGHARIVGALERELAQARDGRVGDPEGPHQDQHDNQHHHHPDDPVDDGRMARRQLAQHPNRQPPDQHDDNDGDE